MFIVDPCMNNMVVAECLPLSPCTSRVNDLVFLMLNWLVSNFLLPSVGRKCE